MRRRPWTHQDGPDPRDRFSVRLKRHGDHAAEIGSTKEERLAYQWCDRYADKTHEEVFIVNVRSGETIYTRKAERVAAARMVGAA